MFTPNRSTESAHRFAFQRLTGGGALPLDTYRGKVVLVVNTASKCGFTPQYKGLQALWDDRREDGLVILGVPSNDFANQEPGSAGEIEQFCELNYGVGFPMAAKEKVTGSEAHPFFRWVASELGFVGRPHWNFYKYLLDRQGHLVDWFSSITTPGSASLGKAIDAALKRQ